MVLFTRSLVAVLIITLVSVASPAQARKRTLRKQLLENNRRTVRLEGTTTSCSGVVIETNLIVTAYHCTKERMKFRGYPAEVVNKDKQNDLALFATRTARFDPIILGESKEIEPTYVFGHHHKRWKTFSKGWLFTLRDTTIKSSVEIQSGDSGSGLFNRRDELVGIVVEVDRYNAYAINAKHIKCLREPTVECELAKEP